MKIATWNVNSLKVRQQHVIDWLALSGVDVLCLQELKMPDEKFPRAELEAAGYKSWFAGQKTYNGVGILVRADAGFEVDEISVVRNIPGFEDLQQRVIAATIIGNPQISLVEIQGHADERGDDAHNLDLTERRALSVRRALEQRNVEPGRLKSHGYGETKPVASNETPEGRAQNRRIEFVVK